MLEKNRMLFGTKIYNHKTRHIGLIIYTWKNRFFVNGGGYEDIPFAACVDEDGHKYNIEMSEIQPIEDMDEEELREHGLI